jgi:hypothetical protein
MSSGERVEERRQARSVNERRRNASDEHEHKDRPDNKTATTLWRGSAVIGSQFHVAQVIVPQDPTPRERMRRQHVRTIREEERPTLLLMAAGAVAGAAAGLYLGRRYRSMDAFLTDMRDRFGALRDIWYEEDVLSARRAARLGINVDDEIDEDEDEDDEEFDELYEEDLEPESLATSELFDDDDEAEDEDEELEDEFEDDLEAAARDNGASDVMRRSEEIARRLEERVLDALRDEPVLRTRSIEIAVVGDGVVELTGSVHAIEEISRAAALVRGVPGVNMVLNRIEVRTGGSIDTASVPRDPASSE